MNIGKKVPLSMLLALTLSLEKAQGGSDQTFIIAVSCKKKKKKKY